MSEKKNLSEHFLDLRTCTLKSIGFLFLGFVVCWVFKEELWGFLKEPIHSFLVPTDGSLIFTSPTEKFLSYIKISFYGAIFSAFPLISWEIWKFVSPGLYEKEKITLSISIGLSWILFLSGSGLCYFFGLPVIFDFLISLGDPLDLPMIKMQDYISFTLMLCFAFGLIFQFPLVVGFLGAWGILDQHFLKKNRSYAVIIMAFFSMLFTPPDLFSMILLLVPLVILYELSILILKITVRKSKTALS